MDTETRERLDRLEARSFARAMGMRALIASHPDPEALMQAWQQARAAAEVYKLQGDIERDPAPRLPHEQHEEQAFRDALHAMHAEFESILGPRLP